MLANRIIGVFLLIFFAGTLCSVLGWLFPYQVIVFSALGVSITLLVKTLLMTKKSALTSAKYLAASASFLIGVSSIYFTSAKSALLITSAAILLLFLFLALAEVAKAKQWEKQILFFGALSLVALSATLKFNQIQYADVALIIGFVLANIWVIREFFLSRDS